MSVSVSKKLTERQESLLAVVEQAGRDNLEMRTAAKPSEDLRLLLRNLVTSDGRSYREIGKLVGVKGPTLHRFLNTEGAGCVALPKLCKLFGISGYEKLDLDDNQRELLRILEAAEASGRDPRAIINALRILTGVDPPVPAPSPPHPRGST